MFIKVYLCWVPPPHVAEHGDQSVHGVQVGHGLVLQGMVSLASPPPQAEGSYPFRTITVHSLIRDFVPPSQLAEQFVHSVHWVHFGQVSVLQVRDSSNMSLQGLSSEINCHFKKGGRPFKCLHNKIRVISLYLLGIKTKITLLTKKIVKSIYPWHFVF